ncbi:hypothetical protein [Corynebacterium nasicanis]|uniref:Uncharacterized protein n=1 Tax=Corynebacterium nasicanis TaxID=1448267 RepID=A0ABW1QB92_9CORY
MADLLVTTWFVADPSLIDAAAELYAARVAALPATHEEAVRQQLFFCDPTERDPFPGFQTHVELRRCRA